MQERFGDAIIHIEKNQIVSLAKPGNGKGGGGKGDGDSGSTTPRAPEVIPWGVSRVGGPQIAEYGTAWVIDTGIDSRHPDLNVDKNRGANFIRGKNTTEDGNGHGTHVAGTIAANFTPASTTHPNVFTISSVDQYDNFSWFSNYGSVVEYALPGENILSTKTGGGTVAYNGTSMAAPHFCGLAIIGSYYINAYANNDPDGSPDPIPSL
ncbi:TPA: S8 family serine peptidase [Photobacterium damselae]